MLRFVVGPLTLGCLLSVTSAQQFPLWEQLLKHYGGQTDETPVPSMKMGHMQMSLRGKPQAGDEQRAQAIRESARQVLKRYADVNTALHDGYRPFHPTGRMGEEVHYTNYRRAMREKRRVDYAEPGSILYRRTPTGMKAVGVMYSAPRDSTAQELDRIVPLSVATWHRHVDFCAGPRTLPVSEQFGSGARFGPRAAFTPRMRARLRTVYGFRWSSAG